ncbi:MAG: helicase, partial [Pseudomonas sp.]|nr:helicase [Pseudomonas sp.]
AQYQARADKHAQEGKRDPELAEYRWWLEEYRVSLFAQQLGTRMPVSDKRLGKQWAQVEG